MDPLHDEVLLLAERLRSANVPVDIRVFEAAVHGFFSLSFLGVQREAMSFFVEKVSHMVTGHVAQQ